ncbi:MAG: CdaR family protein [Acidobacteriota bacterium]
MMSLLVRNWRWKLISLAMAFLLWLSTVGEPETSTSVSVPVQYQNTPRDLEISSAVIDRVRLEVHGPQSKLKQNYMADVAVVVDLADVVRPGERTFPLDSAKIALPPGVRVEGVMPPQVRLRFEKRTVREVPVQVRVATQPPAGYEVVSLRVIPQRVRVEGPESRVEEVTVAETDALDLSSVTGRDEIAAHASLDDPQVRFVGGSRVLVHVEVRKTGSGGN